MNRHLRSTTLSLLALVAVLVSAVSLAQPVPPGLQPGDTYHLVFATSTVHGITTLEFVPPPSFPAFGGVDAADWVVTNAAASGGLLGGWNGLDLVYTSVLSNSTTNAIDRLGINGPLYNTAGQLLATGESDFFDGSLFNPVGFDEFGNPVTGAVWTGTDEAGNMLSNTCGDNWNTSGDVGATGLAESSGAPMSGGGNVACSQTARLYGVSPELTVPVPEPTSVVLLGLAVLGCAVRRGYGRVCIDCKM